MKYQFMRLVKKDKNHIFCDLWNERYKSNIEIVFSFETMRKATIFYNYYRTRFLCQGYLDVDLDELTFYYEKIIKEGAKNG